MFLSFLRASQHPALNVTSTQRNRSDHNAQKISPFATSSSSSNISSSSSLSSEPTCQISMVQDQAQLDIVSISRLAPGESPSPQPFERRSKSLAISCSSQLGTRTPPASCPASPRLSLTPSSAKPQQYSDSSPASPGTNAASFYALCPQTAHSLEASASDYTLTPTRKSTRPPTTPEDSSQSPGSSKTGLRTIGKGFQSHLENPDHERYVSRLHMLKSSNDDQFKYLLYLHVSSVCFPIMTLYFHYILQKDHFHSKRSFPFIYFAG